MTGLLTGRASLKVKYALMFLVILTGLYLASNYIFGRVITGLWGNYLLPSIIWLALALSVYYLLPRPKPLTKPRQRKIFYWAGFLCAVAGLASVFAAGLLEGLGKSPYDHSLFGIIVNLFYISATLLGIEVTRNFIVNYLFAKKPVIGIALTGIIFALFSFPMRRFMAFSSAYDGAVFSGNILFPALAENFLASYLVFLGGAWPALIYRGVLMAFQRFSPILPDLGWVVKALIGTFVPAFCMVLLFQLQRSEIERVKVREKDNPIGWVVVSVLSVIMIWFSVGVFNVFPNVIITGSMSPAIEVGDIVIVERGTPWDVETGDVIQFQSDNVRVSHRVIEILEDERGLPLFITQGDANAKPDSQPVYSDQYVGKVVYVVPHIGWATIFLRSG